MVLSHYFSSFPDDPIWQDAWPPVWQVDIPVTHAPTIPRYDDAEIETAADDASFTLGQHWSHLSEFRCLVIGDFRRWPAVGKALAAIGTADVTARAPEGASAPQIRHGRWMGRGPQLQIDLGVFPGAFWESGAAYANEFVDILRKSGAIVNVEDLDDWVE